MTTAPSEQPVPLPPGRLRFALVGRVLRAITQLPGPLRERILDRIFDGVSSNLPPFPDVLRLVEAAGGVPSTTRWQDRLLDQRPELRAVRVRDMPEHEGPRARLYLPPEGAGAPSAALVWVHGGAFVLGSLDQKEAHWPAIELAHSGVPVLSVDYRMCVDGVHHPGPQDDVLEAWRWASAHADRLGVSPSQLHLGGGSAGGCLVAGATVRLRDEGGLLPASLFLAYPVLQGHLPPPSVDAAATLDPSDLASDEWIRDMFANWAGPASWEDPHVSPGLADLTDFPPTYVLTCGQDPLRRSSEPFAERLRRSGIPMWHDVLEGAEHAPLDRPGTEDGERALLGLRAWLTDGHRAMRDRAR